MSVWVVCWSSFLRDFHGWECAFLADKKYSGHLVWNIFSRILRQIYHKFHFVPYLRTHVRRLKLYQKNKKKGGIPFPEWGRAALSQPQRQASRWWAPSRARPGRRWPPWCPRRAACCLPCRTCTCGSSPERSLPCTPRSLLDGRGIDAKWVTAGCSVV